MYSETLVTKPWLLYQIIHLSSMKISVFFVESSVTTHMCPIYQAMLTFGIIFCRDAPVVVFVRSKFVFLVLRITFRPTGVSRTIFDFSSSNRIIHLECLFGTEPQANSMTRTSTHPSSTRLALSELTLHLNSVTLSIPLSKYFFTDIGYCCQTYTV